MNSFKGLTAKAKEAAAKAASKTQAFTINVSSPDWFPVNRKTEEDTITSDSGSESKPQGWLRQIGIGNGAASDATLILEASAQAPAESVTKWFGGLLANDRQNEPEPEECNETQGNWLTELGSSVSTQAQQEVSIMVAWVQRHSALPSLLIFAYCLQASDCMPSLTRKQRLYCWCGCMVSGQHCCTRHTRFI
jgi:hypothetical protein